MYADFEETNLYINFNDCNFSKFGELTTGDCEHYKNKLIDLQRVFKCNYQPTDDQMNAYIRFTEPTRIDKTSEFKIYIGVLFERLFKINKYIDDLITKFNKKKMSNELKLLDNIEKDKIKLAKDLVKQQQKNEEETIKLKNREIKLQANQDFSILRENAKRDLKNKRELEKEEAIRLEKSIKLEEKRLEEIKKSEEIRLEKSIKLEEKRAEQALKIETYNLKKQEDRIERNENLIKKIEQNRINHQERYEERKQEKQDALKNKETQNEQLNIINNELMECPNCGEKHTRGNTRYHIVSNNHIARISGIEWYKSKVVG
jgi:hypothetical protein